MPKGSSLLVLNDLVFSFYPMNTDSVGREILFLCAYVYTRFVVRVLLAFRDISKGGLSRAK